MNILGIFSNHTNNIIKYNTCLNNISFLKKYLTNIVIVDSDNEKYSKKLYNDIHDDNKIINYFLIKNDIYRDFGKWIYALNNIKYEDYDYILLINDSIIITESLDDYFYTLNNNITNTNLYLFNNSESDLFFINKNIVNNFINFFNIKKNLIYDYESYFYNIELKIKEIDSNTLYFLNQSDKYILKLSSLYTFHENYKETIYGNNFKLFNYSFYKDNYDDIKNLNEDELFEHFITIGQFEGRKYNEKIKTLLPDNYKKNLENIGLLYYFDIDDTFDIYFYKKNNKKIENLSNIDTIFYFINMDFNENIDFKTYNKSDYINNFYINIYKNMYGIPLEYIDYINIKNIKNYIGTIENNNDNLFTEKSCFNEYNIGPIKIIKNYLLSLDNKDNTIENLIFNENIISSNGIPYDFDSNMYKFINKDLSHFNDEQAKNHYLEYGIHESRIYKLPEDFNVYVYKFIYKDLVQFNDEQAKNHYLEYGFHESRIYKLPEDFNINMYKFINKDLVHFNDEVAKNHYLEHGFHELRIYKLPEDFDCTMYKFIYEDLKDLNDEQVINHYLQYGFHESRIYKLPKNFNANIYKSLYDDLDNFSEEELKNHYLKVGLHEKRKYVR